ncbi:MAG: NAD(P)/FAD-dependent oxidoreductase [Flammeovirgaceae bacterium]
MANDDFLIIGGGIFGITSAIALAKRSYQVGLINPDSLPHHLAASTDINKIVRMEYGSDEEYFRMAAMSIEKWKEWNAFFDLPLYHEVGFLMLCQDQLETERQRYEQASCQVLAAHGYALDRLDAKALKARFPAINTDTYVDANFNPHGGYVDATRVMNTLIDYARSLGVVIHEGQTAAEFVQDKGQLIAVKTKEGAQFSCGHAIVAAGVHTPYLLPELRSYMKSTGHPVFWLKPRDFRKFIPPYFSVFTADISNTGWYGFPYVEQYGVLKVAKHTGGMHIYPDQDDRYVNDHEVRDLRLFLEQTLPELVDAPLVYTRKCLYNDTLDGHFWIDTHPEIKGLSVSTGGSGHGLKMAPVLGEMTADVAEGKKHQFSDRYNWRHLTSQTNQTEEARYVVNRKV